MTEDRIEIPDYTTEYLDRLKAAGIIAPDALTANITVDDDQVTISWTKPNNVELA